MFLVHTWGSGITLRSVSFLLTSWFSHFIACLPDPWLNPRIYQLLNTEIQENPSGLIVYILTIHWLFKECLNCGSLTY